MVAPLSPLGSRSPGRDESPDLSAVSSLSPLDHSSDPSESPTKRGQLGWTSPRHETFVSSGTTPSANGHDLPWLMVVRTRVLALSML